MFSSTSNKIRALVVTLAAAFVCGLAATTASADSVQNYWNCRAAGGTPKACCAGVGGTYSEFQDATGQWYAKCVHPVSNSTGQGGTSGGNTPPLPPRAGVVTSGVVTLG